jgi:cell division protein FtsN
MPKDYRRQKTRSAKSSSSNSFLWIVFGILVGVFAAIIFYWKQEVLLKHHSKTITTAETTTNSSHASSKTPALVKKAEKATTTPEFDFYTVLPKTQVTPVSAPNNTSPPVRPTPTVATTPSAPPTLLTPPPSTSAAPTNTVPTPVIAAPPSVVAQPAPHSPALAEKTTQPTATTNIVSAKPPIIPETKTPPIKNPATTNYLVQLGSLKNYADADRLKAELTMSGFDVYIQPYNNNGQIYNRVVMGPYTSKLAATQQRASLQKSGVSSMVVKVP